MSIFRVFLGVLIALLGCGLGVLFAPTSGKKLREKLFSPSGNLKKGYKKVVWEELKDMEEDFGNSMSKLYHSKQVQNSLKTANEKLKKGLSDLGEYSEEALNAAYTNLKTFSEKATKKAMEIEKELLAKKSKPKTVTPTKPVASKPIKKVIAKKVVTKKPTTKAKPVKKVVKKKK